MTAKIICVLAASAFLAGCDYCPRPGVLEFTPQFYYPRTPKYPVPNATPCGVEPGPGVLGKPVAGTVLDAAVEEP